MKGITGYILGAVVLALLGGMCLAAGILDRQIARAQQNVAILNYGDPEEAFATVERYFEYGSRLPWIGRGPLNDVRARKAALQYWQRRYDVIVPQRPDPIGAISPDNLELQLIVAHAVYRAGQARAIDRHTTLQVLDAGINAYFAVLKNAGRHEAAAYNYEYLVRLRNDIDKGRRAPELTDTAEDGPSGRRGGPPPQNSNKPTFKILVPLDSEEMDKGIEPGRGEPIKRRG